MAATALGTPSAEDTNVAAELRELRLAVHRLTATVNAKLATPSDSLTVREACRRLRCGESTLRRLLARRIFTDARPEKVAGAPWKLLTDEIEAFRTGGEDALVLHRERMGRAA